MTIILSPDKFRGSLTAFEVCNAMEAGIRAALPEAEIIKAPLSDGGEGFLDVLVTNLNGKLLEVECHDPLMRPIKATFGIAQDTAFIEMAQASGLALLKKEEQNPLKTTTYGTGELILAAIKQGVRRIILGIGGSATSDGGIGMAAALGWKFLDDTGQELAPTGENLNRIQHIQKPELPLGAEVLIASDVSVPLYGPEGAAYVFGPQKGADTSAIQHLDAGLRHLANCLAGIHSLSSAQAGAGAAGGLGYGLRVFCNAQIRPGVELVMELIGYEQLLQKADLVITGEGKLDSQTIQGKLISGICQKAGRVPVVALCGTLSASPMALRKMGLRYATSVLTAPITLEEALETAYEQVRDATYWLVPLFSK
ncbi:MAG: glycerate kinase [Siphonobacter sp.]